MPRTPVPRIEETVVLVTGASGGIGRAVAKAFAGAGARVFGTSRKPASVRDAPAGVEFLEWDAHEESSADACAAAALERAGRVDILVCNAGIGIGGSIEDVPMADAVRQFDANVFGTLRMLRAVLPGMRQRCSGLVLVVGSAAGRIAVPFQGHYSASKFALEGLVESLRLELRPFGVRAALIEPGDTRTGFTDSRRSLPSSPAYAEAATRAIGVMEKDERSGADPAGVGALALRLARRRRLRVRYPIGPAFQLLALGLKRILPSRAFEAFLAVYYKVPRTGVRP